MDRPVARQSIESAQLVHELSPRIGDTLAVSPMNVLVGPPNSGKTEVLLDILRLAANFDPQREDRDGRDTPDPIVLSDLTLVGKLTVTRLVLGLTRIPSGDADIIEVQGFGPDLRTPYRQTVGQELKNVLYRPLITARSVASTPLGEFMPLRAVYLASDGRHALLERTAVASPSQVPDGLLQALQDAPSGVAEQLDAAFSEAFPGKHVRLDETQRVQLVLRVAADFPESDGSLVEDIRAWENLPSMDEQGSGWRCFAAIVLAMLLSRGRIVLIDQPELSLTPSTAARLGSWIAKNAPALDCQVFIATNSPPLLRTLLDEGGETTVIRTQSQVEGVRLSRVPADAGRSLARHPWFASQEAVDCLFTGGVVLTPDSSDRLFFEAVANQAGILGETRFLHAYGTRHLAHLANVLRQADIAQSVIVGFELLQTEKRFVQLLEAVMGEPPPAPWLATRERLASFVEGSLDARRLSASAHEVESFLDQMKHGGNEKAAGNPTAASLTTSQKWGRLESEGLQLLSPELRIWVEELLEDIKQIGVFVSLRGKVRRWFPDTGGTQDSSAWMARALKTVQDGQTPPDLRAFVTEVLAFNHASRSVPRATRAGNGA